MSNRFITHCRARKFGLFRPISGYFDLFQDGGQKKNPFVAPQLSMLANSAVDGLVCLLKMFAT